MSIKHITPLFELKGHHGPIITVDYADTSFLGNHILATGSDDNTCRIWDLNSKRVIKGIKNLNEPVTSVKFAKKSSLPFLYLSSGRNIHTYDLRAEGIILTEPAQSYQFSKDEINSIDINDNNTFLASVDDEGVLNIIDLGSHKIYKKTTKKHSNICMSVKFRARKPWEVWSGGMDSQVYEWDFSRGSPTHIYNMTPKEPSSTQMFNPPFVYALDISPDGEWIAAGLGDTTIQLLSPPNKKQKKYNLQEIRLENGHNAMVNCLSFLTNSNKELRLLTGSSNSRITVWNPTSTDKNQAILNMYQLDNSIGKLNAFKAYELDHQIHIAAAGTSNSSNSGTFNIYQLC
ncbi:WD40-repeat-containing domain protein [Cokeromyces recurvatus]|uniref:WD40-repeat-containing domain protein n=1 Tax=Cokeromyces recurvatus TaxID=90255 RepID=UPI00221F3E79|nr:WD40-repeat-containing domain protein [Cokeromyces recurvatus]KAI7898169.1 WD40-repeat-containing domain protein [Cokeromyces recurvatus]